MILQSTSCADTSASRRGKIANVAFPPELQVLRFLSGVTNPHSAWVPSVPLELWGGVVVDGDRKLYGFEFIDSLDLEGTLNWQHFPDKLESCNYSLTM